MNNLPFIKEFLTHIKANNYSRETLYNYERDLSTFSFFIDVPFQMLTKQTIEEFKAYLRSDVRKTATGLIAGSDLSTASINRALIALRRYLSYLTDMDHPTPIVPSSIKLLRKETRVSPIIEMKEIVKVIESPTKLESDSMTALRNRAMLETLFASGMRISELLSLKRNQVESTGKVFVEGKGKKQRFIYLTERAKKHLVAYLNERSDNNPYLFVSARDNEGSITANYLQIKMKRYREELGIVSVISAHSLRHAFATSMAENGASPVALQILLGHESLDTTTRYVHASDRYAEDAHKKFHPLSK